MRKGFQVVVCIVTYRAVRIIPGDIDADVGHTILHFLYKGEYETINYTEAQGETHRVEIEYKRSV